MLVIQTAEHNFDDDKRNSHGKANTYVRPGFTIRLIKIIGALFYQLTQER